MELGGSWKNGSPVSAGSGRSPGGVAIVDVGGDTVGGMDALGLGIIAGRRMRAVTLGSDVGATSAVATIGANVVNPVSSSPTVIEGSEPNTSQPRTQTPTQLTPSPRLPSPPQASPPKPSQWRATTGRAGRDLTSRQLAILQDMIMGDEERNGQIWDPKLLDSEKIGGGGSMVMVESGGNGGDGSGGGLNVKKRGFRDFWSGFRKGGGNVNVNGVDDASRSNSITTPTSTSTSADTSASTSTSTNSPTRDSNSFDSSASVSASESHNNASRAKRDQQRKTRYDVNMNTNGPNSSPGVNRPRSPRTPSPSKRTVTAATAAASATASAGASGLSRGKKPLHRPSLAGLFGIGQKGVTANNSGGISSSSTDVSRKGNAGDGGSSSDWDWDLMEAVAFDNPAVGAKGATRRDTFSEAYFGSRSSVQGNNRLTAGVVYDSSSSASPDKKKYSHSHSQIEEDSEAGGSSFTSKKPSLQLLRAPHVFLSSDEDPLGKGGKVNANANFSRSSASNLRIHSDVLHKKDRDTGNTGVPVTKLALTPDNIRPLLKRAREIAAHLNDCIGEVRGMMGGVAVI